MTVNLCSGIPWMTISMTPDPNNARGSAKRLAIYNHKGGVGKTTLTVNLASAIAQLGHNVLLVDSDPQCNLTSYLIEDSVVNDLLDRSDSDEGQTIWSAVKPIVEATGLPRSIPPIPVGPRLSLIPGDVRLAEFEAELGSFWSDCFQRKMRGFRGTSALSSVVSAAAQQTGATVVLYDTGPNIGPLNRIILLDCDSFVVPAACELFSVRAIKTLGHTLAGWIADWNSVVELAPSSANLLPGRPKPLGYIPQRFRVYDSLPSKTFLSWLPEIEKTFKSDLLSLLTRIDPSLVKLATAPLNLGFVPDFGSRAVSAQREGVPLWRTGFGTTVQRSLAWSCFYRLAHAILERLGETNNQRES
ncbi:ParA family protein [Ralstonia mojiangensis]|uniref:ParA family protein n=1 Tax=Ralstonia mojiangensis TaxID=2953895 RepID=UPI0021B3E4AD|nr:ParA family protein [Ralstonia mojiangensis]MCT7327081.1 ParA family protein [Ralstonia mojiangensis]